MVIDGKSDLEDHRLQAETVFSWLFLPDMDDSGKIFKVDSISKACLFPVWSASSKKGNFWVMF